MSEKIRKTNILCVAGFVCSLVALIPCIDGIDPRGAYAYFLKHYNGDAILSWPIAIVAVLAIAGLILSIIGNASCKKEEKSGKAFAIIGIIISILIIFNFTSYCFNVIGERSNPESPPTTLSSYNGEP